eukprot:TRINITY_DN42451_c0_g1_i1.p1 TRINITY_DN42451_c0_g1~~TRINITY_DN42451_c0_g1_i1.p1  ORF type:complete len:681 (+),score=147.02 TRINITY_DN42451_c0_g1_i1:49-2091(+)
MEAAKTQPETGDILPDAQRQHLEATIAQIHEVTDTSARYDNTTPWLSDKGELLWEQKRIRVAKVVMSQAFESLMGVIITFNILVMIFETDQDAMCYPEFDNRPSECPHAAENIAWIAATNVIFLITYTLEAAARLYVERGVYICNRWNQVDAFTVLMGWLTMFVSGFVNLNFMRSIRAVRVVRAARVLIAIREVSMLLGGFVSAMRSIFFGSICLVSVNIIWAILLVQIVHPVNASIKYDGCDYCATGYSSVWNAFVTLFQTIIAGDSWGLISVPAVREAWYLFPVFAIVVIFVGLGIMNLILAVIVERATEARAIDADEQAKLRSIERKKNMVKLATICHHLDQDGSGTMSLPEILTGFDEVEEFQTLLTQMDLQRRHVAAICRALDDNGTGEVSYLEFCQSIESARNQDINVTTTLLQFAVRELKNLISNEVIVKLNSHDELLRTQLQVLQTQTDFLGNLREQKVAGAPVEEKTKQAFQTSPGVVLPPPPVKQPQESTFDEKPSRGNSVTLFRQTMEDFLASSMKAVRHAEEELASLQQSSQEIAIAPLEGQEAAISGAPDLAAAEHAALRSIVQQSAFQLRVSLDSEESLLSKKRQIHRCLAGCLGSKPPSLRDVLQWQSLEGQPGPLPAGTGTDQGRVLAAAPRLPQPVAPVPSVLGLQNCADDDDLSPPPPISNL